MNERMTNKAATGSRQKVVVPEPPVSSVLTDRIAADGEQVGHILDPDRRPETVRYPDPAAPSVDLAHEETAPQSNADIQMSRRTDAGPREAVAGPFAKPGILLGGAVLVVFVVVIVGVILVI